MPNQSHTPSKHTKRLGYTLVAFKEFFNGYDNGTGIAKLPLWIMGVSVTILFAPFVLLGGGVFALLFLARGLYDEYERYKEEQEKIALKKKLTQRLQLLNEELEEYLKINFANEQDIQTQALNNRKAGMRESEVSLLIEQQASQIIASRYGAIAQAQNDLKSANKELLKCLLRDYFEKLRKNGFLPSSSKKLPASTKMLSLIKDVTGYNPYQEDFHEKMAEYFKEDRALFAELSFFFPQGHISHDVPSGFSANLRNKWHALSAFVKRQKKLRHFVDKCFNFVSNFGTGAGIAAGCMTMFGLITIGIPPAWPLLAIILAGGLAYGLLTLAHEHLGGDRARRNTRYLNEEVKQLTVKSQLMKQLIKLQKTPGQFPKEDEFAELAEPNESNENGKHPALFGKIQSKAKIPTGVYVRMALGLVGQIITAIAIGMVVGLGLAWLGTLFLPALPLLAPTLAIGAVFSLNYLYKNIKKEAKSIQNELSRYQEVEDQKQHLLAKYVYAKNGFKRQQHRQFMSDLAKDNKVLLKELLEEYVEFIRNQGGLHALNANHKFPKQEKIFSLIESISGIKREEDENGRVQLAGTDKFYHELARYLKGSNKNSSEANNTVQEFKNLFLAAGYQPLSYERVNADHPEVSREGRLKKVGRFLKNEGLLFLGVVTVALMLPIFLFGPQMLIVAPIAGVVIGAFLLTTIASHRARKNLSSLKDEENKIQLLDRKAKITAENQACAFKPALVGAESSYAPIGKLFLGETKEVDKTPVTSSMESSAEPNTLIWKRSIRGAPSFSLEAHKPLSRCNPNPMETTVPTIPWVKTQ